MVLLGQEISKKGRCSMKHVEDKLLVQIAQMYYQEDKNQSQISKELNIHRSTISRLLKKSREE
jgi:DNA-binding transcriptional regulator LsrR (DeoR family)